MRNAAILLILASTFFSCEKEIEFEDEYTKRKLVVESLFEADSTWKLRLTHSASVLDDNEINPVTNAAVSITDINGSPLATLNHTADGYYESAVSIPAAGLAYKLNIAASGYDNVNSESSIPSHVPIISWDTTTVTLHSENYKKCTIRFQDPATEGDHFVIFPAELYWYPLYDAFGNPYDTVRKYRDLRVGSASPYVENSHDATDLQYRLYLTDNLMNGNEVEVEFYLPLWWAGQNPFAIILYHATEEFYFYRYSLDTYLNSYYDPFSQPVVVYSNITNGLGIFAGSNKSIINFHE
jgi:hypothetical protein